MPGQTSGVEWCLCPGCAELLANGLHRTAAFSVHVVNPVRQFVQFGIEFHLLAHTMEAGHLPQHNPRRKIGEKEAVAFRGLRFIEA